jgi:hypothetical protein
MAMAGAPDPIAAHEAEKERTRTAVAKHRASQPKPTTVVSPAYSKRENTPTKSKPAFAVVQREPPPEPMIDRTKVEGIINQFIALNPT